MRKTLILSIAAVLTLTGCSTTTQDSTSVDDNNVVSEATDVIKLYENPELIEVKDKDGKSLQIYSMIKIQRDKVNYLAMEDWYRNYVSAGLANNDFDYAVIIYEDESDDTTTNGVYADSTGVYAYRTLEKDENGGFVKPTDNPNYIWDATNAFGVVADNEEKPAETEKKTEKTEEKKDDKKTSDSSTKKSSDTKKDDKKSSSSNKGSSNNNTGNNNSNSGSSSQKPSGGNTSSGGGGNTSSGSDNSGSEADQHQHTWVTNYKTVHHDATGHNETVWVEDSPAWDEQVVSGTYGVVVCNGCGAEFASDYDWDKHDISYAKQGDYSHGGYHVDTRYSYSTVHHEATGHNETRWVQDSAAWEEQVADGQICSSCHKPRK